MKEKEKRGIMKNKKLLGQVFTPKGIVKKMISLIDIENPSILEPSSGDGSFYNELKKEYKTLKAIEIDEKVAHKGAKIMDFFNVKGKYDVIIGNPPYVDFKDIDENILEKIKKESNLVHKPNLYMFFLEKCLSMLKKDGELIFITPTEWMTASSAKNLINEIFINHSIQYFEIIPENVWENASITTSIFKIKKGSNHEKIPYFMLSNSKIIMGKRPSLDYKGSVFVKVGAVSGNNLKYKTNIEGSSNFITSSFERTKKYEKMLYYPKLKEWIRKVPNPPKFKYQIFVNTKTRKNEPFYMVEEQKSGEPLLYDASVLSIYCDMDKESVKKLMKELNELNWSEMGIKKNGRHHFSQSILTGLLKK